jgi:hypothetical protein
MVIDCVTYNGEEDLWDLHYNVLKDHVDQFIVVEFDKTFSGQDKPVLFPVERYKHVKHVLSQEKDYEKYRELAENSPNTVGASHWKREFMQKESIKDALTHLKDDDIVFIGDVDEIYDEHSVTAARASMLFFPFGVIKLKLRVYTYWLNNRSNEEFWGTTCIPYARIKNECLNHLRSDVSNRNRTQVGWHFTSMGGPEALKKKLTDSYTAESYATEAVLMGITSAYGDKDFLGRNFEYHIDESEWPQYLKDNKAKYAHLCK